MKRALQRNSSVITWVPPEGRGLVKRGCPLTVHNDINKLLRDTSLEVVRDLESCMKDQALWSQLSSRRHLDIDRK